MRQPSVERQRGWLKQGRGLWVGAENDRPPEERAIDPTKGKRTGRRQGRGALLQRRGDGRRWRTRSGRDGQGGQTACRHVHTSRRRSGHFRRDTRLPSQGCVLRAWWRAEAGGRDGPEGQWRDWHERGSGRRTGHHHRRAG